ncbi:SRPBCC family protein [Microvirga calopogonii]|uniref:SRPBCC family protein n=1 Tax=Microvirga calopogonii TaxID=2078013 RepID=UPI000E0D3064|nr:SRPBCC family protein [Microvirga calopogonii]
MTDLATLDTYGAVTEPATLTIQRLLPGPVERIWAYLTESDLRRQWLAAGDMEAAPGSSVELVWRNDELSDPPGQRPPGFPEDHRMVCTITEFEPPRRLAITWGSTGGVTFTLERQGPDVLLTVIHRRVTDRSVLLNVSAGWHAHLDILAARLSGVSPEPFWESWARLKEEYARRFAE